MNKAILKCHKIFIREISRGIANEGKLFVERLKDRSHILIRGNDSTRLLQRLATNDIMQLNGGTKSLYTLLLNDKGMVLHDAIIFYYKNNYILEVDNKAVQALLVHIKMYQGNAMVNISNIEDRIAVWAIYNEQNESSENNCHVLEEIEDIPFGPDCYSFIDPRLPELGLRIIGPRNGDVPLVLNHLDLPTDLIYNANAYCKMRYNLGIAQGIDEIPYGRCTPFEINADFLHAICQEKINYVGFTGIKRERKERRVLPLEFYRNLEDNLSPRTPIQDLQGRKKTPIGYLSGVKGKSGIGIVNIDEALSATMVRVGQDLARCFKPQWWPNKHNSRARIQAH